MPLLIADFSYSTKAELKQAEFLMRCRELAAKLTIPIDQTFVSLVYAEAVHPVAAANSANASPVSSILAYPHLQEPLSLTALAAGWAQLPTSSLTYSVGPGSNFNRVGEALLEIAGLSYDEEKGWRDRGSVVIVPPADNGLTMFLGHAITHYLQSGAFSSTLYLCCFLPMSVPLPQSRVTSPLITAPVIPCAQLTPGEFPPLYRGYIDIAAATEWNWQGQAGLASGATASAVKPWQLREWD